MALDIENFDNLPQKMKRFSTLMNEIRAKQKMKLTKNII